MIKKCYIIFILAFYGTFLFSKNPPSDLTKKIQPLIKKLHHHVGIEIYSLKKNQIIYKKNSKKLFTPASNTKLFLSLAAIENLGIDYQFQTFLLTDKRGNLFLKGAGDPSLTSNDIENLIKKITYKKINKIRGNFFIDPNDFDNESFAPDTCISYIGKSWFAPVGGLVIDHKAIAEPRVSSYPKTYQRMYFNVASFLRKTLKKHGIKLSGKIAIRATPRNAKILAIHKSKKLICMISKLLKESNNLYADCIFKKFGRNRMRTVGSWKSGKEALNNFLKTKLKIQPNKILLSDGSGLSKSNLVSPHHIVKLLTWASKQKYFSAFSNSLSIAGVDGTLANRMNSLTPKIKAKTGTLQGVSALSGYLKTHDDTLIFSILSNSYISQSLYNPPCKSKIEDAICRILLNKTVKAA